VDESTAKDVAQMMRDEFHRQGFLEQSWAVQLIFRHFDGDRWTYHNNNGGTGIDKTVLRHFRELTPEAIWDRGSSNWERRDATEEGRLRR
jgi:hypothetical protein